MCIRDRLKAGVTVLVTERPVEEELKASGLSGEELNKITVVMVEEGRHALALLSAARFGHPTKKLVMIGVTGTKGKTTTTHMIRAILQAAGKKVGMIEMCIRDSCDTIEALKNNNETFDNSITQFTMKDQEKLDKAVQFLAVWVPDHLRGQEAVDFINGYYEYMKAVSYTHLP